MKYFLLSWVLSVGLGKRHYSETVLVADSEAVDLLVNRLGLSFSQVNLTLDQLADQDPIWWATGKFIAYLEQEQPFIHLESDAFLWQRLPDELTDADLFAQNPEYFLAGTSNNYFPEHVEKVISQTAKSWLPQEWVWARATFTHHQKAVGCGIFGGQDLPLIHSYSDLALRFINDSNNKKAFQKLDSRLNYMLLIEQYLLGAYLDYHNFVTKSARLKKISYLFSSLDEALAPNNPYRYTHLIGPAKRNPNLLRRLEEKVSALFPQAYRCAIDLAEELETQL